MTDGKDQIHFGGVDLRPTSLHGNGAKALKRTTSDWSRVTCRLCLSLRGRTDD